MADHQHWELDELILPSNGRPNSKAVKSQWTPWSCGEDYDYAWIKLFGVRSNATGVVSFTDPEATNDVSRFYRVSVP